MAWYAAGTVALTNGQAAVIGTGTSFLTKVKAGDMFVPEDGANIFYEIAEITSSLQFILKKPYQGTTAQGVGYAIVPTQSFLKELAAQVTDLITLYSDVPANVEAAEAAMTEAQSARSAAVNAQTASEAARDAAEVWKAAAAASAQSASLSAGEAGNAQTAAEAARDSAQAAQEITTAARDVALAARDATIASESAAAASATQAQQAADDAAVNLTEVTATANNALSVANGIDAKAQTALDDSSAAVATANAAQSTANGIDAKAQTALDNSAEATSAINALSGIAVVKDGSVQFTGHQKAKDSTPTDPLHLASKGYVDAAAIGLSTVTGLSADMLTGAVPVTATASSVLLTSGTGAIVRITSIGNITANPNSAGPTAGGRDTSSALPAGWIHWYFIWNGTTLSAIWSAASTPALPPGYTHWAYGFTVYWSGTVVSSCRVRGSMVKFNGPLSMGTRGASSGAEGAAVNMTISRVPPNASEMGLMVHCYASSSGTAALEYLVGPSESGGVREYMTKFVTVPNQYIDVVGHITIPATGTVSVFYRNVSSGVLSDAGSTLWISWFRIPNGG
ncbi:hypothetical protein [Cupriavidus taiwanensis]|uniref:hypothetical protein n=1 Tax=Cupriavidus taiwanensis TaxID=164546 RepID=UPI000E1073F7|nr:hypothetical protein [Cupriavidus taiwanensis]SPA50615.1 protein of unknown function [Cupriavidus taiwanensis]